MIEKIISFRSLPYTDEHSQSSQCPKLSFYFVHSSGALPIKLCTRKLLHAPSQYIAIIDGSKNVLTPGAHLLKSGTRPWKCARRVQGAPLISDTASGYLAMKEKPPSSMLLCCLTLRGSQSIVSLVGFSKKCLGTGLFVG